MYIVRCKSRISGTESICQKDGQILRFENKEEAEKYADECRDFMGMNYHYWVAKAE